MNNTSISAGSGVANRLVSPQVYAGNQSPSVGSVRREASAQTEVKAASKVADPQVSEAVLDDAVNKINAFIAPTSSSIQFSIDQESNRTVVKVIDLDTKQVIRQFPNEEVLSMSRALSKLQGLMVKQTA